MDAERVEGGAPREEPEHRQQLSSLQARHKMLEAHIDRAYEDRLNGVIPEEMWRDKNARGQDERRQIQNQIDSICGAKDDYIENGVLLIELAQQTEKIYKSATPDVKRKLVEIVSSIHVLRNGIEFEYRKPFDLLAKSGGGDGWWTRRGSNARPPECHSGALPAELRAPS